MESRYVCARCKSTFLEQRLITSPQGIVKCPVCGSAVFYDDISPKGLEILSDTLDYESQARQIRYDIEGDIKALEGIGWDGVLNHFRDRFPIDPDRSVFYHVGFNSAADVRLVLRILGWEVTLAIGPDNRVYILTMYRRTNVTKL